MRYKCRRILKPKNGLKDKTFSLLPHELIPYLSFTIDSLMIIIKHTLVKMSSTKEIQKHLDGYSIDEDRLYNIDSRHINHCISLFTETCFKLNQFIDKHNIRAGPLRDYNNISAAIIFLEHHLNQLQSNFNEVEDYKKGYADFSVYYHETENDMSAKIVQYK